MAGVLSRLRPSRAQAESPKIVVDLDSLIAERVGFQFQGKVYVMEPVNTKTFMNLANILGEIQTLIKGQASGNEITETEIYEAYHRYISVLCQDITMHMIKTMQIPQVHGLLNLIIKYVTGQPMNLDESIEKKKITQT